MKELSEDNHRTAEGFYVTKGVGYHKDGAEKIILPKGMKLEAAIEELQRVQRDNEMIDSVEHNFHGYDYNDFLHAANEVIMNSIGWINAESIKTPFGDIRPQVSKIAVDMDRQGNVTRKEVTSGKIGLQRWHKDAWVYLGPRRAEGNIGTIGIIVFEVPRVHKERAKRIIADIETYLKTKSIYKGKTVLADKEGLKYLPVVPQDLVLNPAEETNLLYLKRRMNNPKKRVTSLFIGTYGTGKTETALRIGHEMCYDHGFTFFYVKDEKAFEYYLKLAKNYTPSVVFLEDLDTIAQGDRSSSMNRILNTLGGAETTRSRVNMIFTTNHPDKIEPAFRRPGRIDHIVNFGELEEIAIAKLYTKRFGHLKGFNKLDLPKLAKDTPKAQGATINEICNHVLTTAEAEGNAVDEAAVRGAIESVKVQLAFMRSDQDKDDTLQKALTTIGKHVLTPEVINALEEAMEE